jgi:glucokinase
MARAKKTAIVGIDLGGTNMQIGVVTPENRVVGRSKKKTRASEGLTGVLDRVVAGVREACDDAGVRPEDLIGIGIGAPGAIEPTSGMVLLAPNLGWKDVPVASLLKKRLNVPVILDNDVNAAVYGEWKLGAGKGVSDLLGVWIGTGVGGGMILNNGLYYGSRFTAGEIGHCTLFPNMPPGSRKVEENLSRTALVDRLLRLMKMGHKSVIPQLADHDLTDVRAKTIAAAFTRGDRLTHAVVENGAELMGIVIANAVTLLSLPRVVIGGGLTEAMGESLVKPIRESVRRHVFPDALRTVEVVATRLEADAGLLGAALLGRERLAPEPRRKRPATRGARA